MITGPPSISMMTWAGASVSATAPALSPLALALGAAFATSLAGASVANAAQNPFAMSQLSSGYMVADSHEGKCGEGKCGGSKDSKSKEGSCGEGKCGGSKGKEGMCGMDSMDMNNDGTVTRSEFTEHHEKMFSRMDKDGNGKIEASEMKSKEGKCGEGKCGGSKGAEGKCGEGKCGGSK